MGKNSVFQNKQNTPVGKHIELFLMGKDQVPLKMGPKALEGEENRRGSIQAQTKTWSGRILETGRPPFLLRGLKGSGGPGGPFCSCL